MKTHDLWLTLTCFTASPNFCHIDFSMGKSGNFGERIPTPTILGMHRGLLPISLNNHDLLMTLPYLKLMPIWSHRFIIVKKVETFDFWILVKGHFEIKYTCKT